MNAKIGLHKELNPKIWSDMELQKDVKSALLKIVDAFLEYLGIDNVPDDIWLTGSMANYNYTDVSDIDLHLLYDFSNFKTDPTVAYKFLIAKKSMWNKEHDVKIRGYEVEMYVQDVNEPHASNGVYSIKKNQWIQKPQKQEENIKVDYKTIQEKVKFYKNKIEANKDNIEKLLDIKEKIRQMRIQGLYTSGEYSTENLVFKVLRSSGVMKNLVDYIQKNKDASLSLKQEKT